MVTILIYNPGSYQNLSSLKSIIKDTWQLKEVRFQYNVNWGLPSEHNPDNWPFIAIFDDGKTKIKIHIYSLTAGYAGTGPHDLAEILDFLGVRYNPNDIFTKNKEESNGFIRLHYVL